MNQPSSTSAPKRALLVIDLQHDYFPGGQYPLWNADAVLERVVEAIERAQALDVPVLLVQHVGTAASPFFQPDSAGVAIHSRIHAAAPQAPVVVKGHADSFHQTRLAELLAPLEVEQLLLCGMMTQNCVTHTALSKAADAYAVSVLTDACTTVDELLHKIALNALGTRVALRSSADALAD